MRTWKMFKLVLVLLPFLFVAACGGSGSDAPSTGSGSTAVKTSGVMTKGSVILNGVSYVVSAGTGITVDDTTGVLEDNLKNGMVVRVRGQRNDDGVNGAADAVETENEIQGEVESRDLVATPNSIVVLGQTIYVDDNTVFELPLTALSGVNVSDIVEVHGLRDAQGNLRASRIESRGALGAGEAELKGIILAGTLTEGTSFEIGTIGGTTQFINYAAATIQPAGATISEGDLVEVKGDQPGGPGTVLNALFVQREDLEDAEFDPVEGEEVEVEGFMAGFTNHPGAFTVNGRNVQTTSSTIFRNGSEEDLGNGTKVEVEGHLSSNVLMVRKLTFKNKRVDIQATASNSSATSVDVLGLTVMIAPFTDNVGVTDGQRYRIRGFDDGGIIIAERIVNGSGGGNDWLKALVTAEDEGAKTLAFLNGGVSANLSTNLVFKDAADNAITEGAFYGGVTAGSTIVKVKFNTGTLTVNEASLED